MTTETRRDKYKIAYVQQNAIWGSCEEYLSLLLEGVDRGRYNSALLCPASPCMAPITKALGTDDSIWHFTNEGPWAIPRLIWKFIRLRPDLVHFNDPCLIAIVAARLAGVRRLLMTYHTPELQMEFNWIGRLLWRLAFRRPIHIIALSTSNRDLLLSRYGFQPDYVTVIPHGLKQDKFDGPFHSQEVLRELGIPFGSQVLINVSRLAPQKGHELLVGAVAQLPEDVLDHVRVVLVGDGERLQAIQTMIKDARLQDVFVLTGYRTDVPRLLSASDIFVLSSHFEGLPFAVLEAMAMTKPVIATDVGGVSEMVADGETGIVVPPGDVLALAQAIGRLLGAPGLAQQMGRAGRKRFETSFVQEKMVVSTQRLYDKVLNNCLTQVRRTG